MSSLPAAGLPLLRPRDLVIQLFADALDGDVRADDALRRLAPYDATAARAFEAIVVTELERRFLSAAPVIAEDVVSRRRAAGTGA